MWFKNLLIYRLTQDLPVDAEALEAAWPPNWRAHVQARS
jgi:DNA recombination-dependent growth factor C